MHFGKDVCIALRHLRKSPAFTLVVLATLGLSIGVNTAIYSVLDAVLLRPAPYPQPDRLAMVTTAYCQHNLAARSFSDRYEKRRDECRAAASNHPHGRAVSDP